MLGVSEALAALGASLRLRQDGRRVTPELKARLDAVLDALGLRDAVDALDAAEAKALLAIAEGFLAQAADFVVNPDRPGWDHEQPSILLAQGHSSALIPRVLHEFVVPGLGGDLPARLDGDDGSFLDVGTGVGALAIDMCRRWPSLRVVGLDPWAPALALARDEVAAAGFDDRIELRKASAEALADEAAYDLAWVPTFFIPEAVLERVIERVHAAVRPGGWALLGLYARPDDPFMTALADLRTLRHGGASWTAAETATQMERAGFADVDVRFDPAWRLPVAFVAGRRPGAA